MSYQVFTKAHDEVVYAHDLMSEETRSALVKWDREKRCGAVASQDDLNASLPDVSSAQKIIFLLDFSGSMKGQPMLNLIQATRAFGDALQAAEVPFYVLGYTTKTWKGGEPRKEWVEAGRPQRPGRLNALRHIVFHTPDMNWENGRDDLLVGLTDGLLKENFDGEALEWAAGLAADAHIIYVTDGAPMDDSTLSVNPADFMKAHRNEVVSRLLSDGRQITTVTLVDETLSKRMMRTTPDFKDGYVQGADVVQANMLDENEILAAFAHAVTQNPKENVLSPEM